MISIEQDTRQRIVGGGGCDNFPGDNAKVQCKYITFGHKDPTIDRIMCTISLEYKLKFSIDTASVSETHLHLFDKI